MRYLESAAQLGNNTTHQEVAPHVLAGSQSTTGSKQELQRLAQAKACTAGDASQAQSEAALGQLPAAPLFVAQSPAGKGQADEWVKMYLAKHPTESEEEARRGAAMTLCPIPPLTATSPHYIGYICLPLSLKSCYVACGCSAYYCDSCQCR